MNAFEAALSGLCTEIAQLSASQGCAVRLDPAALADRSDSVQLASPGIWSPNRTCRLVRAQDGWIAVNLAREEDIALVPAWLCVEIVDDPWSAVVTHVRRTPAAQLIDQARLLGLPVAIVGETHAGAQDATLHRFAGGGSRGSVLRVLDMSALWAGPLCGAVFADMGADVIKLESVTRPDAPRLGATPHHARLNARKASLQVDFTTPEGMRRLHQEAAAADVIITSARPRAFSQLGLDPPTLFKRNASLVWVAVSGYGWMGDQSDRVAFGDDAAAAGGLLRWTRHGEPRFIGDAVADPLTGLAAAKGALHALARSGGFLVDAAMARCAAGAAARN